MRKLVYLAVTGIAVAGLTLAMPSESRADHRRNSSSLSIGIGNGGFHFDYSRGNGAYYARPGYAVGSYYAPAMPGGCVVPARPVIVDPYWSGYRPWIAPRPVVVPYRGPYRVLPY